MTGKKELRKTEQRDAIRKALAGTSRPIGPDEILELAQKDCPNIGIATVYRNIKTMLNETHEIAAVFGLGTPAKYLPASAPIPSEYWQLGDRLYSNDRGRKTERTVTIHILVA